MSVQHFTSTKSTFALAELQSLHQWVPWKEQPNGKEKPKKPPINPRTGYPCDGTDPANQGSYAEAKAAAERHSAKGVGLALSDDDDLSLIDLDNCLDPSIENPTVDDLSEKAREIVKRANTYFERSPSKTGVKGWVHAKLLGGLDKLIHSEDGLNVEVYSAKRYGTVTEDHLTGTPDTINGGQEVLGHLVFKYGPHAKGQGVNADEPRKKLGEGQGRNTAMTTEAGRLRAMGYTVEEVRAQILALNPLWNDPPLSTEELEASTFKSLAGWKRGDHRADPEPRRFTFLSYDALLSRPDPVFLVDDFLIQDSLAAIVAPYSSYKSFVAVGIAAAVATGQGWAGRKVERRPVLYVSAEGSAGIKRPAQAWGIENGVTPGDLTIVPEAPNFLDNGDMEALLEGIAAMPGAPGLIVVDTLARCMVGGDENSAKDMGRFVAGCDQLRKATGATVLILHHVPKQGGGTRGSTALPGALDTIIYAERQNGPIHGSQGVNGVELTCGKQKDYAEFTPLYFKTGVVPLPSGETSLVLEPTTDFRMDMKTKGLTLKQAAILDALKAFGAAGAAAADWMRATEATKPTFYRVKNELVTRGLVTAGDAERFVWNGGQG